MGSCISNQKLPENMFRVININDDKRLVQKGVMEVTTADLIYTDGRTKEQWQWPLKFLRKYGCDGDVFSFEAGRKCPGGEGLYAFSTQGASNLFALVARNINQGNLQPPGELSPLPSEVQPPDTNTLNFTRRSNVSSPTHQSQQEHPPGEQPNYQNMDPSGNHIGPLQIVISDVPTDPASSRDSGAPKSDSPPSVSEPKKFQYQEVVFDKPPEEHPVPQPVPDTHHMSYTRIDFERTDRYNRERQNGILPVVQSSRPRVSTSSISSGGGGGGGGRGRPRMNTVPAGSSHRSLSDSSTSSQTSLTESSRDMRSPRANGIIPGPTTSTPEQCTATMYQNLTVGPNGPVIPPQPNYQNLNVGCGDVRQLTSTPVPQPQPNYANLTPNTSVISPTVHGDPMAHYADLDLSSRTRNTSVSCVPEPHQPSYMQLEFSKDVSQQSAFSSGNRSPDATPVVVGKETIASGNGTVPTPKLADATMVNYDVLNFSAMEALSELHRQREQETLEKKKSEQHQERERANTHSRKRK